MGKAWNQLEEGLIWTEGLHEVGDLSDVVEYVCHGLVFWEIWTRIFVSWLMCDMVKKICVCIQLRNLILGVFILSIYDLLPSSIYNYQVSGY